MLELTERRRAILAMVVREHIMTAAPVGSQTLAERYPLGVSPATIRAEMAALEEMGYLTHPHTSAGRVPTVRGYRYFIEQLMQERELSAEEQCTIEHQFHQAGLDLEAWLHLAATVLARSARVAALVTAPRGREVRLKHLQLIEVREHLVLLVAILEDGTVQQQMLTTTDLINQDELTRISNALNDHLAGRTRAEILTKAGYFFNFEQEVALAVANILEEAERQLAREVVREGLTNVLDHPEFEHIERVQNVIRMLEDRSLVEALLSEIGLQRRGVQVIFGDEGPWDELRDMALVIARYGVADEAVGVMGVVGPVRMPYERTIPTVRYVSRLMSDLLLQLFG